MPDNSVAEPIAEYKFLQPFWEMIRTIRAGTAAMRAAGTTYLPQMPAEDEITYENRKSRSVFTNFYAEMVDQLVGQPLKDPIVLEDDIPETLVHQLDNVDQQGNDINVFARNVLQASIDDGLTHILVDFPVTREEMRGAFPDGSLTLAQEQALGVRPYAIHIHALDMIGWKYFVDANGRKVLIQIRYREFVKQPDPQDEFAQKIVERIRVYDAATMDSPGRVRIFEKREDKGKNTGRATEDEWFVVEEHPVTLDAIPLVTMYTNRVGFMLAEPWLLDLAYLNVAHWQSDSDQRNIVHVARVPILFGTGLGGEAEGQASFTLEVGSGTMVKGPKGAELDYVELEGKSIEAGIADLKQLEDNMEALGTSVMIKKPTGSETATGEIIDQAADESSLGLVARELESTLENMLDLFGQWQNLGFDAGGSVTVFKDFGISLGADKDLELLQKDRAAGDISRRSYWAAQQRRGVLPDDFDADEEQELLELESAEDLGEFEEGGPSGLNQVGDTTGVAAGHDHKLQDDGWTNEVNGHRHRWQPEGTVTGKDVPETDGHQHELMARKSAIAKMETQDGEKELDSTDGGGQRPPPTGEGVE